MKVQYIICAVIMLLFFGVFMTYVAFPLMVLAGMYVIFRELKRRFMFNKWQNTFYQEASETATDTSSAGKIIDVEFHEVE